jgi:hypothetical protein
MINLQVNQQNHECLNDCDTMTLEGDGTPEDGIYNMIGMCKAAMTCTSDQWTCGDGSCIPLSYYCDGSSENGNANWGADCPDGSDEIITECCQAGGKDAYSNLCGQDCAGVLGGTSVFDACGVCGGDGSSCSFVHIHHMYQTQSCV